VIRPPTGRAGYTIADYLIGLAILCVIGALALPTLRARRFRAEVDSTARSVQALRSSAEAHLARTGYWPTPADPGAVPPELGSGLSEVISGEAFTLQWTSWAVVDSVNAPPATSLPADDLPPDTVTPQKLPLVRDVGGIVLYSRKRTLLAELLARYGADASFVRDTTWTLLLPQRAGGS